MAKTFLTIGDPHFRIDNIQEVELFVDRVEELAISRKCDYIVCLGDLLHTHERIHTIPLNKAYDFIRRMSIIAPTIVLVGNHDYIQNQQFLTENHWMNAMKVWKNVQIVDKIVRIDGGIYFCPYVPNGRFIEAMNTYEGWMDDGVCIFAHQEFYGCKMGAIVSVEGDKWDLEAPFVVSGHIHSKQTPQANIYYTGSALQHAFGESEKNTVSIVTIDGLSRNIEDIDLLLPRKKIVYLNMNQIDSFTVPNTSDDIKLTISGSHDDFKAFKKTEKFKSLSKDGVKIVFKSKDTDKKVAPTVEEHDFKSILKTLVVDTKNPLLYEQYELVVNNKLDEVVMFVN